METYNYTNTHATIHFNRFCYIQSVLFLLQIRFVLWSVVQRERDSKGVTFNSTSIFKNFVWFCLFCKRLSTLPYISFGTFLLVWFMFNILFGFIYELFRMMLFLYSFLHFLLLKHIFYLSFPIEFLGVVTLMCLVFGFSRLMGTGII